MEANAGWLPVRGAFCRSFQLLNVLPFANPSQVNACVFHQILATPSGQQGVYGSHINLWNLARETGGVIQMLLLSLGQLSHNHDSSQNLILKTKIVFYLQENWLGVRIHGEKKVKPLQGLSHYYCGCQGFVLCAQGLRFLSVSLLLSFLTVA